MSHRTCPRITDPFVPPSRPRSGQGRIPALVLSAALLLQACAFAAGAAPAGDEKGRERGNAGEAAGAPGKGAAPDRVTLLLNWFPEAEHGGYFAAQAGGLFDSLGLSVKIQPGGVDVPVEPRVASRQVDFGVANADQVIFARAAGAMIVALLAPLQTSPRCIMVHASSGIRSFEDLHDMTLAISPKDAFAEFLRQRYPLPHVRVVPYPGSIAPFLNDPRFGQQAYSISEPFLARKAGGDPYVLMLADAGYNPYTSCLVTSEDYLAEHPDVVARMTAASRRGWEIYLKDPVPANALIRSLNPEMGEDILRFGADELQKLVRLDPKRTQRAGDMEPQRWQALLRTMEELKLVPAGKLKAEECFRSM